MVMPTIQLLAPQLEFVMDTTTKFIGLAGSYRAGKTYALCVKAIYLAGLNPGFDGLMTEPTHSMLEGVLIPCMHEVLATLGFEEDRNYSIYTSQTNPRFVIRFPNSKRPVTIYLRASENWDRIRGFSIAWFLCDEFDISGIDTCRQAWQKLCARLTNGKVMQGGVASTKEGFNWMYDFFIVNPAPDRRMIEVYVKDNPFITDDYIETMRAQLDPKQFASYINNEFCNFNTGQVYYCFDRTANKSTETLDKHPTAPLNIGTDFNIGKMATVVGLIIGQQDKEQKIHMVDEIYGLENTDALIKAIKKKYPNRKCLFYPDASGNQHKTNATFSDIQLLRNAFGEDAIHTNRSNLLIADRVGSVNAQFRNAANVRSLLVNDKKCPQLTKSLEAQGYDEKGKPSKDGDLDHFPDALGYFVSYIHPLKRRGAVNRLIVPGS